MADLPATPKPHDRQQHRGSSSSRGYGSKWRTARLQFLRAHPLCVMCKAADRIEPATVVDHKVPHRGDLKLFWDRKNWQSLCKPHHDGAKQAEERSGVIRGCDVDGFPFDPTPAPRKV